ncbi:MAG: ABC transporter substrate-binding protein [Lachnospiraceae bacterium]|jgi:ABC-type sugar transport system substrate-binding protein|nr:ABC transporter substrate-binding protein [Lachnospiraceae bacterium]
MKKKIKCVIWFLISAFILGGCTGKQNVQEPSQLYDETVRGDGYIVVGFSQVGSESDWRIGNTESFRSIFTEENGYYLLFEDGQQKQENQLKSIRNFILQEVDYIILDPIVETGWDAVLQEAKDAGIPVILADRSVKVEDEDLYTCWVGSNFHEEGRRAGEWLLDYLEEQGRSEETINIVTLQGTIDSSAQIGRTEGFKSILDTQANWNMMEYQSADFTQAKGKEVMSYFLEKYDDIDVLVSENDNMTFGAVEAIREAGRTCGPDGEIIILSFDSVRAAMEAMLQGEIHVDFECNPILGPKVEEIIRRLEKGEAVEKIQYVEEQYFDTSMDLEKIMETRTY